jgi:Zn-dependent protease
MQTIRLTLFRLFGIPVRADASWLLIAALITWTLARGVFPDLVTGLPLTTYWAMGFAGLLAIAASIVLHEMAHALVARRYGLRIGGITLFLFGGVAELQQEPQDPRSELKMALAGPAMSIVIGLVLLAIELPVRPVSEPAATVLNYIGTVNLALAVFNLVPAYPLDGGRALRALLWMWKGQPGRATRIAASLGTGFALLLMVAGAIAVLRGVWGGLWWFLIGLFLHQAASGSYRSTQLARLLAGRHVGDVVHGAPSTIAPEVTLATAVQDYFYQFHRTGFPVVRDGRLLGCIGLLQLRAVDRDAWATTTVASAMEAPSPANCIELDAPLATALERLQRDGHGWMAVVRRGMLVGVLTLDDLLAFLTLHLDLDPDTESASRLDAPASALQQQPGQQKPGLRQPDWPG